MNILIVGVGGQGSLLASRVIGSLLLERGMDVKVSEVHGMSQRGGSVVTFVRAGEAVASPLVEPGEADLIIAFEQLEAMRYLPYLKKGGTLALSTQKIAPMPVITGAAEYPANIIDDLKGRDIRLLCVDALTLAESAGSLKTANVVMLGAVSSLLEYEKSEWLSALFANVKPKFMELNLKAFELGAEYTA